MKIRTITNQAECLRILVGTGFAERIKPSTPEALGVVGFFGIAPGRFCVADNNQGAWTLFIMEETTLREAAAMYASMVAQVCDIHSTHLLVIPASNPAAN